VYKLDPVSETVITIISLLCLYTDLTGDSHPGAVCRLWYDSPEGNSQYGDRLVISNAKGSLLRSPSSKYQCFRFGGVNTHTSCLLVDSEGILHGSKFSDRRHKDGRIIGVVKHLDGASSSS
jgi:hypothetical protein